DALDDVADGRRGMPVGLGDLARQYALHRHVDAVAHAPGQVRIAEHDGATAGLVHRHQLAGLHEARVDIRPLPEKWLELQALAGQTVPVAAEVALGKPAIQALDGFDSTHLGHSCSPFRWTRLSGARVGDGAIDAKRLVARSLVLDVDKRLVD